MNQEKLKLAFKSVAFAAALGALICAILTPFFPPAALPGMILGYIALVGQLAMLIELKEYIQARFFPKNEDHGKVPSFFLRVILPAIIVVLIVACCVITSPVISPALSITMTGAQVVLVFGHIGAYALNGMGVLLNGIGIIQAAIQVSRSEPQYQLLPKTDDPIMQVGSLLTHAYKRRTNSMLVPATKDLEKSVLNKPHSI